MSLDHRSQFDDFKSMIGYEQLASRNQTIFTLKALSERANSAQPVVFRIIFECTNSHYLIVHTKQTKLFN